MALTPEYLQNVANEAEQLYAELNQQITNDICRRIAKTGNLTESAQWQVKQLQESGKLMDDIIDDVARQTGKTSAEIRAMFEAAGLRSMEYDARALIAAGIDVNLSLSPAMQQILIANALKTQGDMSRLTLTTASAGQDQFLTAMNEAQMKVQSGAFDYATAFRRAIEQCAEQGAKILYPTGARLSLEAAARTNILTGINQTCQKITELNCDDLGAEYVETSAHPGARPTHSEWQGQVFKREGSDYDHENFEDVCGPIGEGDGICGWNCRHSYFPFFPGISKPAYDQKTLDSFNAVTCEYDGNPLTDYEASQIQRRYERDIRKAKVAINAIHASIDDCKDEELAKALMDSEKEARAKLRAKRERLTDFCKQTGREKDYLRTKVVT